MRLLACLCCLPLATAAFADITYVPDRNGLAEPFAVEIEADAGALHPVSGLRLVVRDRSAEDFGADDIGSVFVELRFEADGRQWSVLPDMCYRNGDGLDWPQFSATDHICQIVDDGGIFSLRPIGDSRGRVAGFFAKFIAGYTDAPGFAGVRAEEDDSGSLEMPADMLVFSRPGHNAEFFFIEER